MIITRPKCFSADDVSYVKAPDAGFLYTCSKIKGHDPTGDWSWIADPKDPGSSDGGWSGEGITSDLMDPLEQIIRALPSMWIEYGVLEYELRVQHPDLFGRHVADRGHGLLAPSRATASSVRFATALVRLERAGIVRSRLGPATGAWNYLSQVSYWALEPVDVGAQSLTWEARCSDLGRNPNWTEEDRVSVAALADRHR